MDARTGLCFHIHHSLVVLGLGRTRAWCYPTSTCRSLEDSCNSGIPSLSFDAAVHALAARVEGNLLAAAQEVDKLKLLESRDGIIGYDQVAAGITDSARFNVFSLAELCTAGEALKAMRTLSGLQSEGAEPVIGKLPGINEGLRGSSVKLTAAPEKVQIFHNGTSLYYR